MPPMQKTCLNDWCKEPFEVTAEDLDFYDKVSPVFGAQKFSIPPPKLCPECRQQRRLANVNDRHLYRRASSKSGKEIIASVSPDKPYLVYEPKEWWSDTWDGLSYGRAFDFDRPIFDQLEELLRVVPVPSLMVDGNENSEYVQYSGWDKNCYLCYCCDFSEDCLHVHSVYYSKNTVDCFFTYTMELCYECVNCKDGYRLLFSQNCANCSDSSFLFDCNHCKNCFGSAGLRNKEYVFFNEQLTKKEYAEKIKEHIPFTRDGIEAERERLRSLCLSAPHNYMNGTNNEGASGDYLYNSKNAHLCFDSEGLQDCKYCCNTRGAKDCQDVSYWGHPGELMYECMAAGEAAMNILFCYLVWGGTENMLYCNTCIACKDCFGCAGLRHKQYCIFNRQYSKEEYEKKVSELITAMQERGEWGQFLSLEQAPFCYNETLAQIFYPMTKAEVKKRGWLWLETKTEIPNVKKIIPGGQLPPRIADIPGDILNWAIACKKTGRPFKIEKKELELYRLHHIPVPDLHPEERLWDRWKLRNPRKLWDRTCAKCSKAITTSYAPERPEIVYCEACYLKAVY